MFREKLITTLLWSAFPIAGAIVADYLVNVILLGHAQDFTPFATFVIAVVVTLPTVYAFIGGRSDLRRARDDLAAARDRAINADRTKSQFLANMSHELRTPLNAILGFSELLSLDAFAGKRAEYAKLVHESGTHLLGLVNELLDLSRIEAGKLELQCEIVCIEALVNECLTALEHRARTGALKFARSIGPGLQAVFCDRRAIKQILLNLLANALKFSPPGGTIEVFARLDPSGEAALGVRDDGVGIADEDQARVFERFGQARHDITETDGGTGLGLPIVKGLVEAHGGRVAMESRLGQGTCVTVWLPRERIRLAVADGQADPVLRGAGLN
jgi:signal transduction histidine kinase